MKVYLDNAASTRVDKEVITAMLPYFNKEYGNASSLHDFGVEARKAIEKSRGIIAKKLNVEPEEIIFTSGGTESNNFAIKGIAFENKNKGNHIITCKIEHECILNPCKWLEKQGFKITYLGVDKYGFVNPEDVKNAITKDTILVSIMHANNEIGTIEPIEDIGKICKERGVYFHTDACQSFTKVPINVKNIDLVTISSHKIHGPKGVGALYVKNGTKITQLQHGGGQEKNLRSGTENTPGIVGFAKASELITKKDVNYITKLRDKTIKEVMKITDVLLNGPSGNKRLCNNANLSFKYIEGESMITLLNESGIACSTGSACSSKSLEPSHVLLAIGRPPEIAHGSLRVSLSKDNTMKDVSYFIKNIKPIVKKLREMSPLKG